MVSKISGRNNSTVSKRIIQNNIKITGKKDTANTLAANFAQNSSSRNQGKRFQKIKENEEKKKKFQLQNTRLQQTFFSQ